MGGMLIQFFGGNNSMLTTVTYINIIDEEYHHIKSYVTTNTEDDRIVIEKIIFNYFDDKRHLKILKDNGLVCVRCFVRLDGDLLFCDIKFAEAFLDDCNLGVIGILVNNCKDYCYRKLLLKG